MRRTALLAPARDFIVDVRYTKAHRTGGQIQELEVPERSRAQANAAADAYA